MHSPTKPHKKSSEYFLNFRKFQKKKGVNYKEILRSVHLVPVSVDEKRNLDLLYKVLPLLEDYSDILDDDLTSPTQDYEAWFDVALDFIRSVEPWFFVVTVNDIPRGIVWATAWESFGKNHHSVEIGGLAARGVSPWVTQVTLYKFVEMVFKRSNVSIIRSEFAEDNRAVALCLYRIGFNQPEPRRCFRIKGGREIMGTIMSVTRSEWKALNEQEEIKQ